MKIRELIAQLSKLNPDDTVLLHLETAENTNEYILAEPSINSNSGWTELITIELGEVVGG